MMISAAIAAACLALATPANAQATRTWVSGVGDDANPCSRTAPCKTFAGAISKTAAGGEISVLDPGGFGALTITKAISLVARGAEGGILASGTNGIVINAGINDNVSLRGLVIEGAGTGINGIQVLQANNVYIADTVIRGFQASSGYGIGVQPSNGPRVYLKNVEINSNLIGVYVHGGMSIAGVVFDNCTISGNATSAATLDTNTSVGRAQGTSFANTPIALSNGAQMISNGNNFFAAGGAPSSSSPLQ